MSEESTAADTLKYLKTATLDNRASKIEFEQFQQLSPKDQIELTFLMLSMTMKNLARGLL